MTSSILSVFIGPSLRRCLGALRVRD